MRDSSVFSFSGEPRSLIFRPREHVPRWRRLGWRSFRLPRGGRVFLDERGELSSRARSFASVRRAGECAHADRDGLDAVRSEEHTSELQSLTRISYAVFCLKKKKKKKINNS